MVAVPELKPVLDAVGFAIDLERLIDLSPRDAVDVLDHWEFLELAGADPRSRAQLCREVFAHAWTLR